MLRIASIDNLSARAYRLCAPNSKQGLRFETPARVHALMAGGHCDAALLPVAELPSLAHAVEPLGPYGIACAGAVQSVQFFSPAPLAALLHGREPIYMTPRSRTSARLFNLLCLRDFGALPRLTHSYSHAAGRVLIGDAAFEYARQMAGGPHNIDLCAWWFEHTGLPFVFARWVVARHIDSARRATLRDWLEACVAAAEEPGAADTLARGVDAPAEDYPHLIAYYQHLRTRLGIADDAGQARFLQLSESIAHVPVATVA